jgi:hypothetical protein
MQVDNYRFHRRALTAYQQLEPDEQAQLRKRLLSLDTTPVAQWPAALAVKLPGDQPLYLVRVNDRLRAFIQVIEGQRPEVLDIASQEMLDFLAQTPAKTSA